ncbi:MAG: quercetin 2,3-dioxygenase, partial [Pseudomonadota bacterium]
SADGRDDSVSINQDVNLYAGLFTGDERARFELSEGRQAWLQVARGRIEVNGQALETGDGLSTADAGALELSGGENAEVLLFDLPRAA